MDNTVSYDAMENGFCKVNTLQQGSYEKLLKKLGSCKLDEELLQRFEKLTGKSVHHFLRRGIYFSHRDFDFILNQYEAGKKFYIYKSMEVLSKDMNLNDFIHFSFIKWLQDVFQVPVIIQLLYVERYQGKDITIEICRKMAYEYIKEIIAIGFDASNTFITLSLDFIGNCPEFFQNILRIQNCTAVDELKGVLNLNYSDSIFRVGLSFAAQTAPAFSSTLPFIFKEKTVPCLIPCDFSLDPYINQARKTAHCIGYLKPAILHSVFLSTLQDVGTRITPNDPSNTTIVLTDTPKLIKNKVNKHAFSGGQTTVEEHRSIGGNCEIDVSFHYLRFFLDDDEKLNKIKKDYSSGSLLTGEIKKELIDTLQAVISTHQEKKNKITDDIIKQYTTQRDLKF